MVAFVRDGFRVFDDPDFDYVSREDYARFVSHNWVEGPGVVRVACGRVGYHVPNMSD